MPTNPFRHSEESGFEQGISLNKPVKAVSDAAQKQAKAFTDDFVKQLYGKSDSSATDSNADPNTAQQIKQSQQAQAAAAPPKRPPHKLGGMSDSGDHAKYAAMQKLLDQGDKQKADEMMQHMQYVYDKDIGTLEEQIKRARQIKLQDQQQRQKDEQEAEEKKKQEEEERKQEIPMAVSKGRNRMGQPPGKKQKTSMAVQMGKMKTEMFRGASG